jgi:ribosomal protein S4
MRIKPESQENAGSDPSKRRGKGSGGTTRAQRASDHAAQRIWSRHAERDYFGRPIYEQDPMDGLSPAAQMRKQTGAARLDAWLVSHGFAASREKAKALIASGAVTVNGSAAKVKASTPIYEDTSVAVSPPETQDQAED